MEGEFRLAPASSYLNLESDQGRQDNEIVREEIVPGRMVKVTHLATGQPIKVIGDLSFREDVGTDYYTLCMSSIWDPLLFNEFIGSDSCLVIHEPDEVCERIHFYVEKELRSWAGIDAAVTYLQNHRLGPAFSKPWKYLSQKEWRFVWHPQVQYENLAPIFIRIGSIEQFAEIIGRPHVKVP